MEPSLPNPYQAPNDLEPGAREAPAGARDASRLSRLWATTIDGVISFALLFPVQLYARVYEGFPTGMKPLALPESLYWALGGFVVYVAVHGVFLARSAQTIGKKLLHIQIVNARDGKRAPIGRILLLRMLPVTLVSQVPHVGGVLAIVDLLFIFRKDRRCIHDHIAGTRVVKV
jgi:uncharacterized RDD family membrane protein YckC